MWMIKRSSEIADYESRISELEAEVDRYREEVDDLLTKNIKLLKKNKELLQELIVYSKYYNKDSEISEDEKTRMYLELETLRLRTEQENIKSDVGLLKIATSIGNPYRFRLGYMPRN